MKSFRSKWFGGEKCELWNTISLQYFSVNLRIVSSLSFSKKERKTWVRFIKSLHYNNITEEGLVLKNIKSNLLSRPWMLWTSSLRSAICSHRTLRLKKQTTYTEMERELHVITALSHWAKVYLSSCKCSSLKYPHHTTLQTALSRSTCGRVPERCGWWQPASGCLRGECWSRRLGE